MRVPIDCSPALALGRSLCVRSLARRQIKVVRLTLSAAERDFYESIYKMTRAKFDTYGASEGGGQERAFCFVLLHCVAVSRATHDHWLGWTRHSVASCVVQHACCHLDDVVNASSSSTRRLATQVSSLLMSL